MQRRIDLLDQQYITTVSGHPGNHYLQVEEDKTQQACLTMKNDFHGTIQLGDEQADLHLAIKGETAFIRAFGRTITLDIVDPVEQASQEAGRGKDTACARAPMPGTVVDVHVAEGDKVAKGDPMITIESMKILTIITAPRDGEIAKINSDPGNTFDKNEVLVFLRETEGQ